MRLRHRKKWVGGVAITQQQEMQQGRPRQISEPKSNHSSIPHTPAWRLSNIWEHTLPTRDPPGFHPPTHTLCPSYPPHLQPGFLSDRRFPSRPRRPTAQVPRSTPIRHFTSSIPSTPAGRLSQGSQAQHAAHQRLKLAVGLGINLSGRRRRAERGACAKCEGGHQGRIPPSSPPLPSCSPVASGLILT